MALMSMTGFARGAGQYADWRYAFEIRSVNGRGLDLRVRVPNGLDALDAAIRTKVVAKIARGSVSINLQVGRGERRSQYRIDTDLLDRLAETVKGYGAVDGLRPASLGDLLAIKGVVEGVEAEPTEEEEAATHAAMLATFDEALAAFVEARAGEGKALYSILSGQLDRIAELTEAAEACPARSAEAIRARLEEQLSALVEQPLMGKTGLDPARLHAEAALLATRADIREELDRLKAHVAQARTMIAKGGAIGRKLDFLAQELNRESNTLCSKSNHVELTAIGLELKTVVDQLKEQVQNIE